MKLKYLITGCGRSGTCYMSKLLSSVNVHCGHESIFDWRGIDYALAKLDGLIPIETSEVSNQVFKDGVNHVLPTWFDSQKIVAESSYMAAPYLNHKCLDDVKFIHIVRNPVRVINSFTNYLNYFQNYHPALWEGPKKYEVFIYPHCPNLYFLNMSQYERAALYYIRWNQMIEEKLKNRENLFYRIEDSVNKVFDFLEIEKPKTWYNDKKSNTFEKDVEKFTLNKLPQGEIKEELIDIGRKYGYSMGVESEYFLT